VTATETETVTEVDAPQVRLLSGADVDALATVEVGLAAAEDAARLVTGGRITTGRVQVNGPLGELTQAVPVRMKVEQRDRSEGGGELVVERPTERGDDRALHGLTRTLIANMVEGVTKGFEKRLEIQGVGYRATLRGQALELAVGYSHAVVKEPPAGISFEVPIPTQIVVKGTDKQQVGQVAADIRKVRPPEPYKGKGIRYEGELVRRKVGKRA